MLTGTLHADAGSFYCPVFTSDIVYADRNGRPDMRVEVDGGVDPVTAAVVARAGADALVAGSSVFGKKDRAAAIAAIRKSAEAAYRKE